MKNKDWGSRVGNVGCAFAVIAFLITVYAALGISPSETPAQKFAGFFVCLGMPVLLVAGVGAVLSLLNMSGESTRAEASAFKACLLVAIVAGVVVGVVWILFF